MDLEKTIAINVERHQRRRATTDALIKASESGYVIPDSLPTNYRIMGIGYNFRPAMTAFKILESKGLDIIRDEALKFRIMELYDRDYQFTSRTKRKDPGPDQPN